MKDLKLVIREKNGDEVARQDYHSTFKVKFNGPYGEKDDVIRSFPKYTRGKVKHDIMYHETNDKFELVMSAEFHAKIDSWRKFSTNAYDFFSYTNYVIPEGKGLYIEERDIAWSIQSIVETYERSICEDVRYIHSLDDLRSHDARRAFLEALHTTSELFLSKEYFGYDDERVALYIKLDGHDFTARIELSYEQKKLFKFKKATHVIGLHSYVDQVANDVAQRVEAFNE